MTARAALRLRHFCSSSMPPGDARGALPALSSKVGPAASDAPRWHRWLRQWDRESGTHEILQLKRNVNQSSLAFDDKQRQVSRARAALDRSLQLLQESQAKHTQLLGSRDRWTPAEAKEFARLLEREVQTREQFERAKKDLATLEADQLRHMNAYMNDLRRRYQEEQLWQDRWRIYSTFGTWSLLVLNSVVFFSSQYLHARREERRMADMRELLLRSLEERHVASTKNDSEEPLRASSEARDGAQREEQGSGATEGHPARAAILAVAAGEETGNTNLPESPSCGPQNNPMSTHWIHLKHSVRSASAIIFPGRETLDVSSAVFGASVTG